MSAGKPKLVTFTNGQVPFGGLPWHQHDVRGLNGRIRELVKTRRGQHTHDLFADS